VRRWLTISTKKAKTANAYNQRSGTKVRRVGAISFPNRIGEFRSNATPFLSQRDLSMKVGISERQFRRIEQGRAVPNARLLLHIAKALGITTADLYLKRRDGGA
jgi:ribosome-binding protein aMBF1 (putative translation factor)